MLDVLKLKNPHWTDEDVDFFKSQRKVYNKKPSKKTFKANDDNKHESFLIRQRDKEKKLLEKEERSRRFIERKKEIASRDFYDEKIIKYKRRAAAKKIDYTLTKDQFIHLIDSFCIYCGENGGTIDRIDSKMGYTVDNSQSCCWPCNAMKYVYSHEEFLNRVKKIYLHNAD